MKLFGETSINEYFKMKFISIRSDIERMQNSRFMQNTPEELAKEKVDSYKINHLEIDLHDRKSNIEMVNISGSYFPITYRVDKRKSYPCAKVIFTYNLPKQKELLSYMPTDFYSNTDIYYDISSKLNIYFQTLHSDEILPDNIKNEIKNYMIRVHEQINKAVEAINRDIDVFNEKIQEIILNEITERTQKIILIKNQNEDLNNF